MNLLATVLSAMVTVGGVVIVAAWGAGVLDAPAGTASSTGLWTRAVENLRRINPRTAAWLAVGLMLGVVVALWTGWPLMLVVVPVAVIGLPHLLSAPRQAEIELLGALDRWVRGMTAALATGRSITDVLRLSARQPPAELADPLVLLVRRLDDRWTPDDALAALADDLDNADADAVIASLILAVRRGGSGAIVTLAALADSIQDRLRALREIESERAKPRAVVRQVTIITLVVLGGAMLFGRGFFAPYGTPLGQLLLAVLLVVYVGSLAMLRRMTLPRRRGRILRARA